MNSNYITTYRKDFKEKRIKHNKRIVTSQEFKDPLSESFRHFLKIGLSTDAPGLRRTYDAPIENAEEYLDKFKEVYPKLGELYFNGPINKNILERSFKMDTESIYQTDYCDKEKDRDYVEKLREMSKVTLNSDWFIPLTTQNASYRNAQLLDPNALDCVKKITPQHNLKNQERILQILGVRTGESEYTMSIGKLGQSIVEDHLHGKIYHPKY